MKPVVTRETASSSMPETRIVCRVCQKQFAQYTCPRCNARYCSLQCYRGHSARCTESFMRDNVVEEMQHVRPDDETKRKMLEILKRLHSEEEMEHEDENDPTLSQETIQKFLSGNDILRFEDLSLVEMKRFQRAVASGTLSKMIEPWDPWWTKPSAKAISLGQDGTQLVRSIDECDPGRSLDMSDASFSEIPAGPDSPLPPLSKLSSTVPSPLLGIHLVDVSYSYCFTLRFYNGDWNCDALGAAMVIFSISSVLGRGGQPESVGEALNNCIVETCSPIYRHAGGFRFAFGLVDDVATLFSLSTNALICLLCDLRRLILAGEKMFKTEKTGKTKRDESRRKLKVADRKLYFLMCWAREQPSEVWSCMQSMVNAEKTSLSRVEMEVDRSNSKVGAREEPKSSALIEEI